MIRTYICIKKTMGTNIQIYSHKNISYKWIFVSKIVRIYLNILHTSNTWEEVTHRASHNPSLKCIRGFGLVASFLPFHLPFCDYLFHSKWPETCDPDCPVPCKTTSADTRWVSLIRRTIYGNSIGYRKSLWILPSVEITTTNLVAPRWRNSAFVSSCQSHMFFEISWSRLQCLKNSVCSGMTSRRM